VDRRTSRLITGIGLAGILIVVAVVYLASSYAG